MIRKTRITLIALTILASGNAFGALEALEEVAELDTADIRLPAGAAGQVVHRGCSGCEPTIWSVNSATTYHVGTHTTPVPLGDLRQAVSSKQYELIYVFYAPDSGVVTRIVLDLTKAPGK